MKVPLGYSEGHGNGRSTHIAHFGYSFWLRLNLLPHFQRSGLKSRLACHSGRQANLHSQEYMIVRGKRSFSSLGSKQASLEQEPQHPLRPLLIEARQALEYIEQEVHDYTCNLVKRERIAGELLPQETLFAKVLHGNDKLGRRHRRSIAFISVMIAQQP
ncbi:MAG: hypothetical protein R3C09_00745 [Pirellulaceae bacterium]